MEVLGVILLLVSGGLYWGKRKKSQSVLQLRGVEQRKVADLVEIAGEISEELGTGSYSERVEIVGDVECDQPLVSPLAERPCVYYSMSVTREIEEKVEADGSAGSQSPTRTRRTSETVSSDSQGTQFRLNDGTGAILVDSDQASYDGLVQTVSRFDRGEVDQLSYGTFTMVVEQLVTGQRTLGYQYEERIIPVDRRLTVIGEFSDQMGQPALRKGKERVLISTRAREEVIASGRATARFLMGASAVCGAGGVVALIVGLLT